MSKKQNPLTEELVNNLKYLMKNYNYMAVPNGQNVFGEDTVILRPVRRHNRDRRGNIMYELAVGEGSDGPQISSLASYMMIGGETTSIEGNSRFIHSMILAGRGEGLGVEA